MSITLNMELITPDETDQSFVWADKINAIFEKIDSHTHNLNDRTGVYIDLSSVRITDYFKCNDNSYFSNIGYLGFVPNNEVNVQQSIFFDDTDLFFYDGFNNKIKMTRGGKINVLLTQGGIKGDYPSTAAEVDYVSGTQTYVWKDSSLNPAILKADTIIGTNLTSSVDIICSNANTSVSFNVNHTGTADTLLVLNTADFSYDTSSILLSDLLKRDVKGNLSAYSLSNLNISNKISFEFGEKVAASNLQVYYDTTANPMAWFIKSQAGVTTYVSIVRSNSVFPNNESGLFYTGGDSVLPEYGEVLNGIFTCNLGSFFNRFDSTDDFCIDYELINIIRIQFRCTNKSANVIPIAINLASSRKL